MPNRIQRKRSKGWRMPENTVYVGRPSKWGNPYHVGETYVDDDQPPPYETVYVDISPEMAVDFYRKAIENQYPCVKITVSEVVAELHGKHLACWCPLDQPCHADVLLELANTGG